MNKKNIILIIILAISIVIFILSKGRENIQKRINLLNINENDISKIVIQNNADSLSIVKLNEYWHIENINNAMARNNHIKNFLREILNINTSELPVSENPERHNFYNVDDKNSTKIYFYGKDKRQNKDRLLDKLHYGQSQNFNFAYIRNDKSNQVYQIKNLNSIINTSLNLWREDRIFPDIIKDDIVQISINNTTTPESSFQIFNNNNNWEILVSDSTLSLNTNSPESITFFSNLQDIKVSKFYYIDNSEDLLLDFYKNELLKPDFIINLTLYTGNNINLSIAKVNDYYDQNKSIYIASINDKIDTVLVISETFVENLISIPKKLN